MYCTNCGCFNPDDSSYCSSCGSPIQGRRTQSTGRNTAGSGKYAANNKRKNQENIPAGIAGALIGAIIGGAMIILLSRLGYVSAASGVVLAACVIGGYHKLAKDFSILGLVISLVLIVVTPYLADRLDWALLIVEEYGDYMTLFDAFAEVHSFVDMGIIDEELYTSNLLQIYGFAALGGIPMMISSFKKK